jgi:YcaO-like protein with predicted kinase domain
LSVGFRGADYRSAKTFRFGTHRSNDPSRTLDLIRPFLASAGVTRIADITGLDHIGVPTTLALRPNSVTIACSSGKGITLEQAYVSGAMEAIELYAAETADPPTVRASTREVIRSYPTFSVDDLPLTHQSLFNEKWPFFWNMAWDLLSQSEVPVPAALVGMSPRSMAASLGAFLVSSNGLGSGTSFLEAITAALLEVIERDALACVTYAMQHHGHLASILGLDVLHSYPLVVPLVDRCNRADVELIVSDYMVDTNVPTYVAHVYDRHDQGVGVMRGSGSHLDPQIALVRAITEAMQGRLCFIAGSRDDIFRSAFAQIRAERDGVVCALNAMAAASPAAPLRECQATDTFEGDLHILFRHLTNVGAPSVAVVDLTPNGFPVSAVRVIVPGFEGYMHHNYRPGRRAMTYQSPTNDSS